MIAVGLLAFAQLAGSLGDQEFQFLAAAYQHAKHDREGGCNSQAGQGGDPAFPGRVLAEEIRSGVSGDGKDFAERENGPRDGKVGGGSVPGTPATGKRFRFRLLAQE